jgi:hypothetical chaperone protein
VFAGFDYGTSHCSIGVIDQAGVRLLPLEGGDTQIPSTLFAIRPDDDGHSERRVLDLADRAQLRFGYDAVHLHHTDPDAGLFVKSPKSFLGAPGLSVDVTERFIGVVGAMMENVKRRAEADLDTSIEQVVIGRPINFQGAGGEQENHQALTMLISGAREAGFDQVTFLYEPMAAAMDYEATLTRETLVLVVDVGGGTTDCSMVRVGPDRRRGQDRDDDVLGHAGERLGGNDYDQALALACLMPSFGFHDDLRSGLPIPNTYFVDAAATNDVNAQQRFYADASGDELRRFVREGQDPARIRRLLRVHERRLSHRLLRVAEESKICLSQETRVPVDLGFVEGDLAAGATRIEFQRASKRLLDHLAGLIGETLASAGTVPEVVYLTGGMSRSEIVRAHLREVLPGVEMIDSDHLASVTQGLTLWAERTFGGVRRQQ